MKKTILTGLQILAFIENLSEGIIKKYSGQNPPKLIIVTNGGLYTGVFLSISLKKKGFDHYVDTIGVSRYIEDGIGGKVYLKQPPKEMVKGQDVIIVDDLIKDGDTALFIKGYLLSLGAKNVDICALIVKEDKASFIPDFYGVKRKKLPWLKGFGMDKNGLGRGDFYIS